MTDTLAPSVTEPEPGSLLRRLKQLQDDAANDMLDIESVQLVTEALLEHYRLTPDAALFEDPLEGPGMLAQFLARYCGVTLATLSCRDLEEVLFDVIPAKVSAGSEIAKNVIDTARAFFVWMKREHALEQAIDIIDLLNDDATRELEKQMEDPLNYGSAKAMIMQAMAAGVDLSSKEAVDAFMISQMYSDALPDPLAMYGDSVDDFGEGAPARLSPEQQRASQKKRKKNRKASRKARKKNR